MDLNLFVVKEKIDKQTTFNYDILTKLLVHDIVNTDCKTPLLLSFLPNTPESISQKAYF